MSDAELIYNACLRAERRLEQRIREMDAAANKPTLGGSFARIAAIAVETLREEIGKDLAALSNPKGRPNDVG